MEDRSAPIHEEITSELKGLDGWVLLDARMRGWTEMIPGKQNVALFLTG